VSQSSPQSVAAVEQRNKAVVRRAYEQGMNRRDMSVVDEVFAPDYVAYFRGEPPIRGRDAFKVSLGAFFEAFDDLVFTVEDAIAEGDRVAVRWTGTGIHAGEYRGMPPTLRVPSTGRRLTFTAIDLYRLEGGLIVEEWNTLDQLELLHQMGAAEIVAARG
jgi:predicted ester cyclase